MTRLTAKRVKAETRPGRYGDGLGLYLTVWPGGSKSWIQRITVCGQRTDLGLGSAEFVSLAQARESAFENYRLVRKGGDPRGVRRASKAPTFREAAEKVHAANKSRWSKRQAAAWLSVLERYAFGPLGDRRVDQIERDHLLRVLSPVWAEKRSMATKLRGAIRATLDWALAHKFIDVNPAEQIAGGLAKDSAKARTHHQALPYTEVGTALDKIEESSASPEIRAALRICALTACRSGEVRGMEWSEVDLEAREWRIPASRMKTGIEHRVPLSVEAVRVLETMRGLHDRYVFPSRTRGVMPDATLSKLLARLGIDATVHGFRTTFRVWAAEQSGETRDVAELCLAHQVGSDVERSYARTTLYDRRRELMDAWAAFALAG